MSKMNTITNPTRRRGVWPVSRARAERLSIPVPLIALAIEADIATATLSLFERGLARLSDEQEARRRAALARLKERHAEAGDAGEKAQAAR